MRERETGRECEREKQLIALLPSQQALRPAPGPHLHTFEVPDQDPNLPELHRCQLSGLRRYGVLVRPVRMGRELNRHMTMGVTAGTDYSSS